MYAKKNVIIPMKAQSLPENFFASTPINGKILCWIHIKNKIEIKLIPSLCSILSGPVAMKNATTPARTPIILDKAVFF